MVFCESVFVFFFFLAAFFRVLVYVMCCVLVQILGQQSQAHDAVLAIMKGAMTLINNEETVTADKLMPAIKNVSLGTLNGVFQLLDCLCLLRITSREAVVLSYLMRMETELASQVCQHPSLPSLLQRSPSPLTASVYNMFPIIDLPGSPNDVSTGLIQSLCAMPVCLSVCVCVCVDLVPGQLLECEPCQ